MRYPGFIGLLGALAGCSSASGQAGPKPEPPPYLALTAPVNLAEGHTGKPAASAGPPAPPSSAEPDPAHVTSGGAPDPDPPLKTAIFYRYHLVYLKGDARVVRVERVDFGKPTATARRMGRFAIELYVGHELVERVRFDFPGLVVLQPATGPAGSTAPRFEPGTESAADVLVPDSDRATSAVLVDRLIGRRVVLPYPPETVPAATPAASAVPP